MVDTTIIQNCPGYFCYLSCCAWTGLTLLESSRTWLELPRSGQERRIVVCFLSARSVPRPVIMTKYNSQQVLLTKRTGKADPLHLKVERPCLFHKGRKWPFLSETLETHIQSVQLQNHTKPISGKLEKNTLGRLRLTDTVWLGHFLHSAFIWL